MKKPHLRLSKETIRLLAGGQLQGVNGQGTTGNAWCTEGWTCAALTGCQTVQSVQCQSGYQTICDCPPVI